jgi:ribosomal-protein-alanine N-acetyltransferase
VTLPPDTVRPPCCGRRVAWHSAVPRLVNGFATLREISVGDAPALLEQLADPIALRHVAPCPATIAQIRRFARWARETRGRGRLICFAVIPAGCRRPVGLMQLWPLDRDGTTAEWGVVIGRAFWGSGLFPAAASLLLQFAFDSLGVARLQARTAVGNDRAGAAMQKIGATAEGRLKPAGRTERAIPDVHRWSFSPGSAHIAASIASSESTLTAAFRSDHSRADTRIS